jgi:Fe-S oxidoreductase
MPSRLPLVDVHERAHTFCAYCPKLCRFSCPVSTVQARESTTPWGKMSAVHHVARGTLPLEPSLAASFYACTGCGRCKTFCVHENEVAVTLDAARAEAVRGGAAPAAALDVIARHEGRVARAVAAGEALFDASERGAPEPDAGRRGTAATVFVPGCTAVTQTPEAARDGFRATRALAGTATRVETGVCCGLPLLEAGDLDGFVASARAFLAQLAGARDAVFQDPGCLHALRVEAKRFGVDGDVRLRHLAELAGEQLARLGRIEIEGPLRYHDPCRLGRGLGVYEAPRAALARITGRAPEEFAEHHERAGCSGAGGQLPRTDRGTAEAIAAERLADHARSGGGTVVTACPASARSLARAGTHAVIDLATLLAQAL